MRLIFMGTPDFAVPTLDALVDTGHDIAAVYCQPPRPAGRGKTLTPTPVHRRAQALGLTVRHPATLRDQSDRDAFAALEADAAVVAAYGLILPQPVLDAPRLGCFNVHASLLPRWRGAAPIHRAILAGDRVTGVTIMQMERGLDTGPMLATVETPIDDKTTGGLTGELARAGAALMVEVLGDLRLYPPRAQPDEGVTYAAKIEKQEAALDLTRPADEVLRQVRAFAPAPGAFLTVGNERIRILSAGLADGTGVPGEVIDDHLTIACGAGAIRPVSVQRAGRGVMSTAELLRGFVVPAGARL